MVNMDVFSRSVTRDATITPYATWKKSLTFDTLPLALARVTGVSVPQKSETTWLNPFFGPPGTYPRVSLIDVLSMSRVQLIQNFRDRYVFIGESGTAIHDAFVSPVTGTMMDGVESHAHFLDGLLQGKMLSRQDDSIFFLSIAILVLLTTSLYFFLPRLLSPIFAIVSVLLIIYVSRVLYDHSRIVVDILFYLFAG
jgi:CHASE2 domain-containing sensor protein